MKTSVSITLILAGAFLIVAPLIADQFHQARLAELLARPGVGSVHLDGRPSEYYRLGCWLAGCLMIGLAVRFSVRRDCETNLPPQANAALAAGS